MNKMLYWALIFIFLVLLQVFVLCNINFLGHINPYLYISFIFFYPLRENKFTILIIAFFLGLCIDGFLDYGGIHTFATVFITYIRVFFFRVFFKKTEADFLQFRLETEPFGQIFNYVVVLTCIHHLILFSFANFSFSNISDILLNTLTSSIFTLLLFFTGMFIFLKKQ